MLRQQARLRQGNNAFRAAGGIRPLPGLRGQHPGGQFGREGANFIERLIQDAQRHDGQGAGDDRGLAPNIRAQQNIDQQPQAARGITDPSEENISLLMEMGFSRERVIMALRETNNNVQLATAILLQD